jgi:hypothetical protein
LSSPHLEASPATTFRACSSPAPTRVKTQPAPAILSQESVDTTLSITHHTRKRPSTGPRTTHGPHSVCIACSSSSCEFARRSVEVPKFCGRRFGGPSARHKLFSNSPQVGYGPSAFRVRFWWFCCVLRTIHSRVANRPPGAVQSC